MLNDDTRSASEAEVEPQILCSDVLKVTDGHCWPLVRFEIYFRLAMSDGGDELSRGFANLGAISSLTIHTQRT